jgi:hypothetical protein
MDPTHRGNEKLLALTQELAPYTPAFLATPELMPRALSFAWTKSLVDLPHHKISKEEREQTAKALIAALRASTYDRTGWRRGPSARVAAYRFGLRGRAGGMSGTGRTAAIG